MIFKNLFSSKTLFLFCMLVLLLLLFKNPFSVRNLVPNFEPFPDTFQYVNPALSLVKGEGMKLVRDGNVLSPNVAPLYSLALLPIFLIKADPRMFYFANVILALFSAAFFYLILKKLTQNVWILGLVLFLYVTNYYIYWYPTMAMADNLLLTLFILGLWLLVEKPDYKNIFFSSIVSAGFLLTKYSALPLSLAFLIIFFSKIIFSKCPKKEKARLVALLALGSIIPAVFFYFYELYQGIDIFNVFASFIFAVSPFKTNAGAILKDVVPSEGKEGFSLTNFWPNFKTYLSFLTGAPVKFLWSSYPLFPFFVAVLGLIGPIAGTFTKNFKRFSWSLIFILLTSVLFMSAFNPVDARYVYFAIPASLIGAALFLIILNRFLEKRGYAKFFHLLLLGMFFVYLANNVPRVYHQIGVNVKGVETPWYYVAVQELNGYFTKDKIINGKKPIVITSLPPYLVDYYSNGNFTLLPLSKDQDFRCCMEKVWGRDDYADLPKLYQRYLRNGYRLYVGGFGIENQAIFKKDFDGIRERFQVSKVVSACYSLCNVYRVEEK